MENNHVHSCPKSFEKDKWPLILWKQGVAYMRKVLLNREGHLNSRHALRVISKYELTIYKKYSYLPSSQAKGLQSVL